MKLLALVEGAGHVCYRYRLEAFAPALRARGWQIEPLALAAGTLARARQLRQAARADVVVLQRKLLPIWQLCLLRQTARVLIYDFDDAVFQRDSYHRKGPSSSSRLLRFWATVYAADAVTAGNGYLRQRAASYTGPERVYLFPTCVDPDVYPLARHWRRERGVRLVWIGQRTTLPSLYQAGSSLAAAAASAPGLELRVVSDVFPELAGVRVVPRPWSSATETAELAEADIGVSWLPDDAWSRGKCGLKVLQYMAAGLPVVANPVGMNAELVVHGRTGFLAATPDEWARAVRRLAADPDLRLRMGSAARRRVEHQYSVAHWSSWFATWVSGLGPTGSLPGPRRLPAAGTGLHAPRPHVPLSEFAK